MTGVTAALSGVLFGVDGVANKQAWVAWVNAPEIEKPARFASAQAVRWVEWGITSYQLILFGLALVLFAIALVWSARVPRPAGYLLGLSGPASGGLGPDCAWIERVTGTGRGVTRARPSYYSLSP